MGYLDVLFPTAIDADHSCAASNIMKSAIDVYCGQNIIDHYKLAGHRIYTIEHKKPFNIGTFTILPLSVPHDKDTPNMAFLLAKGRDKFLFLVDCLYFPYLIPGLTGIGIGINFDGDVLRENVKTGQLDPALARRITSSHMSLSTALTFFRAQDLSQVQEIHILHVSGSNANKDRIKEAVQRQTGKLVNI